MNFREYMKEHVVLFDGAMGTQIQQIDLPDPSYVPDELCLRMPEAIEKIHLSYLQSGADVLTTNTFGANAYKCSGKDYSPSRLIPAAIDCAKRARMTYQKTTDRPVFIALDLGPIGALLKPSGHLDPEEAYAIYREQVLLGVQEGVDLLLIETQTDLAELKCAVLACKENSDLPILCTMSFERSGRTFTGTDPLSMAVTLEGLGVDAIGLNCSFGTKEMRPLVQEFLASTDLPIMVQPNAGLPTDEQRSSDEDLVSDMRSFVEQGVQIIGGCCGTTPELIGKLFEMRKKTTCTRRRIEPSTRICSYAKTVTIGDRPRLIGERINPSNKPILQREFRQDRFDQAIREAVLQVREGAEILDINVGTSGIDEKKLLPALVHELQSILDVPLQIDSTSAEAIEMAVRRYNGKPLINSVNGKEESLCRILPIAKKYGACVLGLMLDESGIPMAIEGRLAIARKILDRALQLGIPRENVLIDALTLTISTSPENAKLTCDTLRRVKKELGLCTVLGVSNISFGLPNRSPVNQAFLLSALESGLDLAIINPGDPAIIEAYDSFLVLSGRDRNAADYIAKYAEKERLSQQKETDDPVSTEGEFFRQKENALTPAAEKKDLTLPQAILGGLETETIRLTERLLEQKRAIDIIDDDLIPILSDIGAKFERGELFLPQLIQASQTVKVAFDLVKEKLTRREEKVSKGKILLATVEHDVHDIGKNIVRVVLENYGFEVIDLGKDVPAREILRVCKEQDIRLVGLSALMTTTVASMEKTIRLLKQEIPDCFVIAGGAVLSRRFAKEIGADRYAKHPSETAEIAGEFFERSRS